MQEAGRQFYTMTEELQTEIGRLREKIGVVPQKAVLFKGSLREKYAVGAKKDASDEEIWSALKTAQAKELRKRAWGWI